MSEYLKRKKEVTDKLVIIREKKKENSMYMDKNIEEIREIQE